MNGLLGIDTSKVVLPKALPAGTYDLRIVYMKNKNNEGEPLSTESGRKKIQVGFTVIGESGAELVHEKFLGGLPGDSEEYTRMREVEMTTFIKSFDIDDSLEEDEIIASAVGKEGRASLKLVPADEYGDERNEVNRYL